jgi:hypothetical protein
MGAEMKTEKRSGALRALEVAVSREIVPLWKLKQRRLGKQGIDVVLGAEMSQDERSKCLLGGYAVFALRSIGEIHPSASLAHASTESAAVRQDVVDREVAVLVKRMNLDSPLRRPPRTDDLNRWPFSEGVNH